MKLFFIFSSLFLFTFSYAQQVDSTTFQLRKNIESASSDSIKSIYLLELADMVQDYNLNEAKDLVLQILEIAGSKGESSDFFLNHKAITLNKLGLIERKMSNHEKALENYLKALRIREMIKDSIAIGQSYHNIGMLFRFQKDYKTARSYFQKAILTRKEAKDTIGLAKTYSMYGVILTKLEKKDSALHYYHQAKNIFDTKSEKKERAIVEANIAILHTSKKNYNQAIDIFKKHIDIYKELKDYSSLSKTFLNIAKSQFLLKQDNLALESLREGEKYALKNNVKKRLSQIYFLKSKILKRTENFEDALTAFKQHRIYRDSVYDVEKTKRITALSLNYEFEKEKLADSLNFANEKNAIELKAQTARAESRWYLTLLLLSLIVVVTLFLMLKNRKKIAQERLEKDQLEKQLLDEKLKQSNYQMKQVVADNSMRLKFKQEFLEKIILEEQKLKNANSSGLRSLITDLQSQIITENKFETIGKNVKQLDKIFNEKLRILHPNLTKSEREVCALMRMNLSLKEIMTIRNVSLASIKSTRYRIRKKMGLKREQELEQVILDLV